MSKTNVIAVFDIGKTNKKFFLLDESYSIVLEKSVTFPETHDEDGDACDDIGLLAAWTKEMLSTALKWEGFSITAVNFSAYGASFVFVDGKGNSIAPLYNYLKKYPTTLKDNFYNKYGGELKLSCETASPVLGSLNSGMQVLRVKHEKPSLFESARYALHLPQYLSFIISHAAYSDITSIGCHTNLWDFQKNEYHRWVNEEGIAPKLAPIVSSDHVTEVIFDGYRLKVGAGLHDSSAALIPYLALFKEPFVLLSTGTWCISLNPFNKTVLTAGELADDCLCYIEYQGHPVKASRLFAGYEHEQQTKRLAKHFKTKEDFYKRVKYDAGIVQGMLADKRFGNEHEIATGVNQSGFARRDLSLFESYEEAYHCLLLDIIRQQQYSTQLVISGSAVTRLFVDGGFSNNSIYMHLLAMVFPGIEVYAASVAQATAIGAALAIHRSWNKRNVPADMVKLRYYKASGELNPMVS